MSEFLRRSLNNRLTILASGLAIGAGATAGIYEGAAADGDGGGTCESPPATSSLYSRGPNTTPDRSTWKTGIKIDSDVPAGTKLIIGWSNDGAAWHESNPVVGNFAKETALKIGNKAVSFRTQLVAVKDTPACETPPDSHFSEPQPYQELLDEGAVAPTWPDD